MGSAARLVIFPEGRGLFLKYSHFLMVTAPVPCFWVLSSPWELIPCPASAKRFVISSKPLKNF